MIRLKRLFAHDFKQLHEIELAFPEVGRILVEGKNEAGKSTLFEAIFFALFGQALATESSGRPNLEDLIGYEKNKARVELDLSVRDRLFRITRTLNRGKPNVWELEIVNGDQTEQIKGNRAVNDRLVLELGFDSEALLNTCFVEQKKLEKLEGLNKNKREESLSKLLNLERLLNLEEKLRLHVEDEKLLSRLTRRVDLGKAQQELPTAQEDLARSEGQLKLLELRAKLASAIEEKRAAISLRGQLEMMQSSRDDLSKSAKVIEDLDRARRSMSNALDRYDLLLHQKTSLQEMLRERDEVELASRERLPLLEKRTRGLLFLARRTERLGQIEKARSAAFERQGQLTALQSDLALNEERRAILESQIGEQESRVAELENLRRNYQIGEALGAWAQAARHAGPSADGDQELVNKKVARELADSRQRSWLRISGVLAFALISATALIPLGIFIVLRSAGLALGVGGLMLLADAAAIVLVSRRAIEFSNDAQKAATDSAKAEGESVARRKFGAGQKEGLAAAQARLQELGVTTPASSEAAESRRIEIAATLENKTQSELDAERDAVSERLNYARAQRDEVAKRIAGLAATANEPSLAKNESRLVKATAIGQRWRPSLEAMAARLETAPTLEAIREARQITEGERRGWEARIRESQKTAAKIREGEQRSAKIQDELRTSYQAAAAFVADDQAPWTADLPRSAYAELESKLSMAFQAQGGEQVRARLNSVQKELGACERELALRDKAAKDALDQAISILKGLGASDSIDTKSSIDALAEFASRLQAVNLADKPQLEARVRTLHMRVGALSETRDRLERELGLQGETIELVPAEASLADEKRQQEERKYGAEMVQRARKRIVQKVLPATMDYMRRILPQLTRDRYHDAELDPETYKIRVWDERAGQNGAWKEKNIFSGGTKDQFSLALRLAFALATLPQERGTSPGFIFLDEPLGSFDEERSAALLYLLTEGEIARAFDQIFLISHVRVQEDRFTHQIRLENGSVVESTLPTDIV